MRAPLESGDDLVEDAIDAELASRRLAVMDAAVERFNAGRESGVAVDGLDAVCAALRSGSVDTLLIDDLGDATVLVGDEPTSVATDVGQLSEFGSSRSEVRRADEALPFAALATGAQLVCTDERIEPANGCAALLRFAG